MAVESFAEDATANTMEHHRVVVALVSLLVAVGVVVVSRGSVVAVVEAAAEVRGPTIQTSNMLLQTSFLRVSRNTLASINTQSVQWTPRVTRSIALVEDSSSSTMGSGTISLARCLSDRKRISRESSSSPDRFVTHRGLSPGLRLLCYRL